MNVSVALEEVTEVTLRSDTLPGVDPFQPLSANVSFRLDALVPGITMNARLARNNIDNQLAA